MNKYLHRSCLSILAFSLAVPCYLRSEEAKEKPTAQPPGQVQTQVSTSATLAPKRIVYVPPLRGAPKVRVTGATRGSGESLPSVSVLAPEHVGLTTKEQPSLFWHQSQKANAKFELTLLEGEKIKPVLEITIHEAQKAGIQRLKLSDHGVKLSLNIEYQWIVALVTDPKNRSDAIIASGMIKRIEPADLPAALSKVDKSEWPFIYAAKGIWYDAVESLSDLIDAQPDNKTLREQRADLLKQVGLTTAAAFDARLAAGH